MSTARIPAPAQSTPLLRRAAQGTIWSLITSVAVQAASFAGSLGLARILGRQVFGEWGIIQNTIVVTAGVAQLAMAATATKYAASSRHSNPERLGAVLALCSLVTLATGALGASMLLVFPAQIAEHLLNSPGSANALRLAAPFVLLTTVNGYQSGALAGFELFRPLALLALLHGSVALASSLLLGYRFGVNGAVVGLSLGAVVNWGAHQLVMRRTCRELGIQINYRAAAREAPMLSTFAIPTALAAGATSVGVWAANLLLVARVDGHSAMAIVTAANNLKALVLFGPTIVNRVAISMLANLEGNKDWVAYSKLYRGNVALAGIGTVLLAVPVALWSRFALSAFGKDFQDGAPVVAAVAFSAVFEMLWQAFHQKLYSSERMWTAFSVAALRAAVLVGGSAVLVGGYGALGIGFALLASNSIAALVTYAAVRSPRPAQVA